MTNHKNLIDVIGEILNDCNEVRLIEDEEYRTVKATDTLVKAMFLVQKLLGEDVLKAALGSVDETDPVSVLKVSAARLLTYAGLFRTIPEDAASPIRVAEEAMAVANGDAPTIFSKLKSVPKTKYREHKLKLRAIVWDAFLKGQGMNSVDRAWKIGTTYGADWSTINTSWRRDIRSLGKDYISFFIEVGEAAGRRGTADWDAVEIAAARGKDPAETDGKKDWEVAMALDARRLQEARRNNAAGGSELLPVPWTRS